MRILVTGGAGYVGSTLVPYLLENGHDVRLFDSLLYGGESMLGFWAHPRFEFIRGDIRDNDAMYKVVQGMDAVVQLAAIVGDPACARHPEIAKAVNLRASLSLLEQSHQSGVGRFVFASTCSNYGRMSDPNQYVDETSELRPVSLYAETKVAVEEAMLDIPETSNFCPIVLRMATVFGVSPRMRFDLTINQFVMEMLTNKYLAVYGKQFWRPYIHVRDVARAISILVEAPAEKVRGQVFNVGSTDQNYRKQDLVELIQPYAPDAFIEYVHKDEDPRDYRVSFAKIRAKLDFEIVHTVTNGIQEVRRLIKDSIFQNLNDPRYRN
jgi:nucleoside-diphosphate-sugar epimerase